MLDVIGKMFKTEFESLQGKIQSLVPSYGMDLNADPKAAAASLKSTAAILKLKA
jgi:hypothetical protein